MSIDCESRKRLWPLAMHLVLLLLIIWALSVATEAEAPAAVRFAVISDLHVFDPSLGTEREAFEDYLRRDRKLLAESTEILSTVVDRLIGSDVDFVLVAGDLTKDGELVSHQRCRRLLEKLERADISVLVVPGNHDVSNGAAVAYTAGGPTRVPALSARQFAQTYGALGYGEALDEAPDSLSYVAEPMPGIWVLALDACRYQENPKDGHPLTGGHLSAATLEWAQRALAKARTENKMVLGLMHHGLLEHYRGQQKYYSDYLVEGWQDLARQLAHAGLGVVFTGHYHAQDIVVQHYSSRDGAKAPFIYDIETGSLVTYPCPYRLVELDQEGRIHIQSYFLEGIPGHPTGWSDYARGEALRSVKLMARSKLMEYRVRPKDAEKIATQVAEAVIAHLRGDEKPPEKLIDTSGTSLWTKLIVWFQRGLIKGFWHDLEPPDNELIIDLGTGEWYPIGTSATSW